MDGMEKRLAKSSPEETERIKSRMFKQLRDLTPNRATIVLSQRDNKQPNDLRFGRVSREEVKLLESSYPVGEEDLADAAKMALDAMDEKFDEVNKIEGF